MWDIVLVAPAKYPPRSDWPTIPGTLGLPWSGDGTRSSSGGDCLTLPLRAEVEDEEAVGITTCGSGAGGDMVAGGGRRAVAPPLWNRCDSRRLRECRMRVSSAAGSTLDCLYSPSVSRIP